MKFTAQEEYGLRCLLQIVREPSGFLTITEIAKREGLTPTYVAKLMRILRQGSLVKSTRGQQGGFELVRLPEEITVAAALEPLGGRLYTKGFCARFAGSAETCVHDVDCSLRALWMAVDLAVHSVLGKATLKDLLCSESAMASWASTNAPGASATRGRRL